MIKRRRTSEGASRTTKRTPVSETGRNGKNQTVAGRRAVLGADEARRTAAKFCVLNYPTMYTGWNPRRDTSAKQPKWIVSVVLTHPEHGVLGEVGEVLIDGRTGEVLSSTPAEEVVSRGAKLARVNRHALAATWFAS